ncbi:MAG: helix-turn-helix domain-containing protein [Pseudomonadota bacterium]
MKKRQSVSGRLRRSVYLLVFDRCQILDFAGPAQVFTCASQFQRDAKARFGGYALKLISTKRTVVTESGISVGCELLPENLEAPATLLIVGGPGVMAAAETATLRDWYINAVKETERWGAICTGSLALAAWGLLDGKRVTTHWDSLGRLSSYSRVRVENDALFVRDGRLWTSAGISSGIDMALAMVGRDAGTLVAAKTAQQMVLASKRSGSQSQYSDLLSLQQRDADGVFAGLHAWLEENLSQPISLADMAEQCAMSTRSLQRHYKAVLGTSPSKTLNRLRLDRARTLLDSTEVPVSQVANQCGYGSVQQFSKDFRKAFGVTPSSYRNR